MATPSVNDVIQARLAKVRKLAVEVDDAEIVLRQWWSKLMAEVKEADAAGVPKTAIAEAAKVSRSTLYSWLDK